MTDDPFDRLTRDYAREDAFARSPRDQEVQPRCPGSGESWGSGTGSPICRMCHTGPGGLGVKRPLLRKGRWTGRVPEHTRRMR